MKKVLSILLILILSCSVSINVFVYEGNGIDPTDDNDYSWELDYVDGTPKVERWSYTNSTTQTLTITNGVATISATVTGYSNVTKIIMYMYLQQSQSSGGWKNLASYSKTVNSRYAGDEHKYSPCEHGHDYRLMCSYYVYVGDQYEHIIAYSDTQPY